ncbi:MAG TPA: hypothetical protein VHC19_21795 [Pirellulales bacterium]|jgi:hypothetical protein|nr:hypothetical protein [Pirellulales bacterium]
MSPAKRKRLVVEPAVQRAFLLRAVLYWLACVLCLGMTMTMVCLLPRASHSFGSLVDHQWLRFLPAFVVALALLPAMAYDMARLTNRLVGPLMRLRWAMQDAAQGERIGPLRFREGDFWRECADEFNAILERLQEAEAARRAFDLRLDAANEPAEAAER